MTRHWIPAALAVALLLPLQATAAPRKISIGPITGDRRAVVATQLAETLCGSIECVLWPRVSTAGRPDAAKMRRAGVEGVLTGALRGSRLALVLAGPRGTLDRWVFTVGRGRRVPDAALDQLAIDLGRRLAPAPAPAPAPPPRPAPAAAPPAPAPAPSASPPQPAAKVVRPPEPAPAPRAAAPAPALETPRPQPALQQPPAAPAPARPRAAAARPASPRLAIELGGFWASRALDFGGVGSGTAELYTYDASAILGPQGRLELYPAAGFAGGLAAGIGVFADARLSVGLTTEVPGGADENDSTFSRISAGALWRLPLGSRLVLVPALSYESLRLTVDPSIPGLPDADLSGFAGRLGLELSLLPRVKLLLAAGYVSWFGARDLVEGDVPYFPDGSASALEGEAGLELGLGGRFSLKVVGELSSTGYDLDPDPTGTYVATDATDRYVGAKAAVRAVF